MRCICLRRETCLLMARTSENCTNRLVACNAPTYWPSLGLLEKIYKPFLNQTDAFSCCKEVIASCGSSRSVRRTLTCLSELHQTCLEAVGWGQHHIEPFPSCITWLNVILDDVKLTRSFKLNPPCLSKWLLGHSITFNSTLARLHRGGCVSWLNCHVKFICINYSCRNSQNN